MKLRIILHMSKAERRHTPGMAFTEISVSARCCILFEKAGETREGGKVIMPTAFDNRTTLLRDLTKDSMSHSYKKNIMILVEYYFPRY